MMKQDVHKMHLNGKRAELLAQIVVQKAMFDLIEDLLCGTSPLSEADPGQYGTAHTIVGNAVLRH